MSTAAAFLLAALLSLNPREIIVQDRCDVLMLNRVFHDGRPMLEQWIAYRYDECGELYVAAWKLVKNEWRWGEPKEIWFFDAQCVRRLRFNTYVEASSNYDVEMRERAVLPENLRPGWRAPIAVEAKRIMRSVLKRGTDR